MKDPARAAPIHWIRWCVYHLNGTADSRGDSRYNKITGSKGLLGIPRTWVLMFTRCTHKKKLLFTGFTLCAYALGEKNSVVFQREAKIVWKITGVVEKLSRQLHQYLLVPRVEEDVGRMFCYILDR